jgi:hypothetical protein
MKVVITNSQQIDVEFESESEFRDEHKANLLAGGLRIPTTEDLPEFAAIQLILKLNGGGEATVAAMVVRRFDGAIAVAIEGKPEAILAALLARPAAGGTATRQVEQNAWDKVRALSRIEKLILAPKADRSERAVLAQDNDAQVLHALLRNPRITLEEVTRIARSTLLSAVTAELIAKTAQWSASAEIRSALVGNPRTPTPLALRLLPPLPEPEIRQIAKSTAVSQALKQAALRLVINRK